MGEFCWCFLKHPEIVLMSSKNCVSSDLKSERTTLVLVSSSFTHCNFPTSDVQFLFQHWWDHHSLQSDYSRCHAIFLWWFLSQQNCSFHILSQYQWTSQRMHRSTGFIFPFLFQLASSSQCVFFHCLTMPSFNSKAATMPFSAVYLSFETVAKPPKQALFATPLCSAFFHQQSAQRKQLVSCLAISDS